MVPVRDNIAPIKISELGLTQGYRGAPRRSRIGGTRSSAFDIEACCQGLNKVHHPKSYRFAEQLPREERRPKDSLSSATTGTGG